MNQVGFFLLVRCLYSKQNNTWLLGDMEFLFSCSTRYLNHSLRPLVRYRVEHSKRNSISPRAHVLFSIYRIPVCKHQNESCIETSRICHQSGKFCSGVNVLLKSTVKIRTKICAPTLFYPDTIVLIELVPYKSAFLLRSPNIVTQ